MNSLLFLGKEHDEHTKRALDFCARHFEVTSYLSEWGQPLPGIQWNGEYIISYLSRWVVPSRVLGCAKIAAINFHPAPPEYPGIGCTNFALYDNAQVFGVTCHYMSHDVDAGPIIAVKRFAMYPSDNVASLLDRTYDYQLALFYDIVDLMLRGVELPRSPDKWTRKPYTRKEFNELFYITLSMSEEEKRRRTRAVTFGEYKPVVKNE